MNLFWIKTFDWHSPQGYDFKRSTISDRLLQTSRWFFWRKPTNTAGKEHYASGLLKINTEASRTSQSEELREMRKYSIFCHWNLSNVRHIENADLDWPHSKPLFGRSSLKWAGTSLIGWQWLKSNLELFLRIAKIVCPNRCNPLCLSGQWNSFDESVW